MTKHWRAEYSLSSVPNWVPQNAIRYLAHIEKGISIRALARQSDVHPSTVMRQIRRVETKRDDPLIDEALWSLSLSVSDLPRAGLQTEASPMNVHDPETSVSDAELGKAALEILQRLSDEGSVLAFAKDMEKAVVVRDLPNGTAKRTAVVDRPVARAMALKDWISCKSQGRISRYQITAEGRAELARLMAFQSNARSGFGDDQVAFEAASADQSQKRRVRFSTHESPVAVLARRKDKGGQPFLGQDLVAASERLREDFELSQIGTAVSQNWDRFLTAGTTGHHGSSYPKGQNAQTRLNAALEMLGEGLSDVALRCCCHQEGMESVEKRLGWPARSGKVVLRIALTRLCHHYANQASDAHEFIG
ncbi:DUF6456 domain-containing protein [Cognatishimia activa]|uniref:DUF6456 domain-containing protein n=1 Tax=Cognatishimia activa TaxID=1715691 RepID=A0A0P1IPB5_9RHOB|nr:DUF6456 domain-containing protein [Cognatishimia activa]CUJ24601.1 hypothetical protein TA5113_02777 [Cognatishimia activa]CUK25356.1 hypothetical protein TA5114_01154 [Cognatishimia activa]